MGDRYRLRKLDIGLHGYIDRWKFVVNLGRTSFSGQFVHSVRRDGVKVVGIFILASCEYHFIRVHENLAYFYCLKRDLMKISMGLKFVVNYPIFPQKVFTVLKKMRTSLNEEENLKLIFYSCWFKTKLFVGGRKMGVYVRIKGRNFFFKPR